MATNSIFKNITIKSRVDGKKFVNALEVAKKRSSKNVTLKKQRNDLKREDVKKFFEGM